MTAAVGASRRTYRANMALLCIDAKAKRVRRYYRRPDGRVVLSHEAQIEEQRDDFCDELMAFLEKRQC